MSKDRIPVERGATLPPAGPPGLEFRRDGQVAWAIWPRGVDDDTEGDHATVRVDAPARSWGILRPPVSFQCWRIGQEPLRLYVLTPPAKTHKVAEWFRAQGVDDVDSEDAIAPRSLWVTLQGLPKGWPDGILDPVVHRIDLHRSGAASVILSGNPADVEATAERLQGYVHARSRTSHRPLQVPMTPRQREVLQAAVAMGYYEVPRTTTLRELASALGMSPAATSEILRRGEALLLTSYFDADHADHPRRDPSDHARILS